ncbi:hypothetical protein [Aureispira sp. CCB-QB1]|uniref:hypothetical protein n=1 Tax=Aureispira sp. CCB-QB1 TaxID=1313421 RepID=UPI000698A107|nr:hypothetical protein [Aureispira sp. CCB-QB1]
MQVYKLLFGTGLFILIGCGTKKTKDRTTNPQEVNVKVEVAPSKPTVATTTLNVDQLIQKIDQETAEFKPIERNITIQEIHECAVKDYKDLKKYVFCFAGGMKAQEAVFYYHEGKPIAALYTLEEYNASPANLAAYEADKTKKRQVKLYFKDGDLRSFDKVVDLENKAVVLDKAQTDEWEILIAAIQ